MNRQLLQDFIVPIILTLVALSISCNSPTSKIETIDRNKLFQFDYNQLVGEWKEDNNKHQFIEHWQWNNDSTLLGIAYEIIENDSTPNDTVQIDKMKIADPTNQATFGVAIHNKYLDTYLWFEEKDCNTSRISFENPNPGFPNLIHYSLLSNSRLKVEVEGEINDTLVIKKFEYQKME